jgi:hypothetical protein
MSTLLDVATYQALTGDTETPTDAQLAVAQRRVEAFLHRPVPMGTYTHRLRIHRDGVVYPPAHPIADAGSAVIDGPAVYVQGSDSFAYASSWQTVGFSLYNNSPYAGRSAYGELTYTGGWTADTVPQAVLDGLAWETWRAVHPGEVPQPGGNSSIAVGATSLATGDVSVSYGGSASSGGGSGVALAAGGDVMAATAAALVGYIHREATAA